MGDLIFKTGIGCIILAIVGGGASAFGLRLPVIKTVRRQVLLALFGAILILGGLWAKKPPAPPKRVHKTASTNSSSVNVGCKETASGSAPTISFGSHPSDVVANTEWIDTNNIKSHTQAVIDDKDATGIRIGVSASGSITGLDESFGCPGGGHGTLALHVTWIEDAPLETPSP